MAHTRLLNALFISFLLLFSGVAGAQTTDVSPENAAVNAAIEKAQATLPAFFERIAKPRSGDSGFLVKIKYAKKVEKGGYEHIWAGNIVKQGENISATISNEPVDIPHLSKGQRVTVPITQLTDWLYVRDGKYVGAYTVRALLPFMKKDQADEMRKRLAPE